MYKLLLCLRYLRTRYLAFVCIVSVMLGVATLIVVNSVMSGFSNKLKDRLHGILADVLIETERTDGFDEPPAELMARVLQSPAGQYVEAVSPTVETFALLQFTVQSNGRRVPVTKHVRLVGIDPERHAAAGRFAEYLARQKDAARPSFELTPEARQRLYRNQVFAGWEPAAPPPKPAADPDPTRLLETPTLQPQGAASALPPPELPAPEPPSYPGLILGYSIAHYRYPDAGGVREVELLAPGDDVTLATVSASGTKPVLGTFAVADFFQSEMSEYDNSFVYVPLADLQRMRGMGDRVNALQVRLKPGLGDEFVRTTVVPQLQGLFHPTEGRVSTWQQKQGPILDAIAIERGILNVLLFLIVGVAGFSVLAIFTMIVAEKYRDIGVLKSLGASDRGVLGIFVGYGLLLGLVGCGLGTAAGLLITDQLNVIEAFLTRATGQQVFDRTIYYFDAIPTNIEPLTVVLVNLGAVAVAVGSSVVPALRAARLHPVRALRFE